MTQRTWRFTTEAEEEEFLQETVGEFISPVETPALYGAAYGAMQELLNDAPWMKRLRAARKRRVGEPPAP